MNVVPYTYNLLNTDQSTHFSTIRSTLQSDIQKHDTGSDSITEHNVKHTGMAITLDRMFQNGNIVTPLMGAVTHTI